MTPTVDELREEQRRLRIVRFTVDFATQAIMQGRLRRDEAEVLVAAARARILELFPGRDKTYDLLYSRRFARLLDEFASPRRRAAAVIPFPRRPSGA